MKKEQKTAIICTTCGRVIWPPELQKKSAVKPCKQCDKYKDKSYVVKSGTDGR